MNPPYGRVRLAADERRRFSHAVYGHANLYGLFMAAGVDRLADGGVLAALVPTSFTAGRYFSELRSHLGSRAPMREIVFVERRSGVFDDVLQETCLAAFSRSAASQLSLASLNGRRVDIGRHPAARAVGHGFCRGEWRTPRSRQPRGSCL